jgi:glutamyl-tRNA reductase
MDYMLDKERRESLLVHDLALPRNVFERCECFEDEELIAQARLVQYHEQKLEFCSNQPKWAR